MRRNVLSSMALVASLLLVGAAGVTGLAGTEAASAASAALLPSVSGSFGQTPKITFPAGKAPTKLESEVLHEGSGPVTKKGDLLVANYLGQIWRGKVFDSSFGRHQLSGFAIGVGEVIKGWDDTLVGVHAGSRLLLVVPPADGYGKSGEKAAGITGTDTLVFVVDVVASYDHTAEADSHATLLERSVGGVKVSGRLGGPPTITIAKDSPKPKRATTTLLARGRGRPLGNGLVVIQFEATNWKGAVQESTWETGTPYGINLGLAGDSTIFDSLKGVPIGSRVLLDLPKSSGSGPYALVIDVVAQPSDPQS